jgi:tetratricopeptide (TPR) repeat protein
MNNVKITVSWLMLAGLLFSACSLRVQGQGFYGSFDQGLALFNQGNFEASIPYFRRASEEDPNSAEAYFYLGRAHLSSRHWREAIQPLRTAYRLSPENTRQEVYDLLLDALFAATLGSLDPQPSMPPPRFKDTL